MTAHTREKRSRTRRNPRQARAVDTVETIFEAAARIIQHEGVAALNTNRIAERAGIAIGTLYGYFPNKQAILLAMARRDLARTRDSIRAALDSSGPDKEIGRAAIEALVQGFGGRGKVRRVLLETAVASGHYAELAQPVENLAGVVLDRIGGRLPGGMTEAQVFVMTRALVGVIRAAAFEDSPLLGTQALEDELLRLARGYWRALSDRNTG
jgi:AcrR family transcriptional regulator